MRIKLSGKELIEFNKIISLLLLSRLSVVQSLEIYNSQTKNKKIKFVIKKILADLKSGHSITTSFGKFPEIFSDIYLANLKIGEETGQLPEVLSDYTKYIESIDNLKRQIVKAVRYPALVLVVAFGVVAFMVFFLIPTFESLFTSTKIEMPGITKFILGISYGIEKHIYVIFAGIAMILFLSVRYRNSDAVRKRIEKILIRMPLISKLYIKNLLARFALSMSMLLRNKVNLLDALKIARNISGNRYFKAELDRMIKRVVKGEMMSKQISNSRFFDLTFTRLLTAGEESAELEKVFSLISNYYSQEFDYHLENITSLIEPALILSIGVIVAFILVAMYLPMFELINYFGV